MDGFPICDGCSYGMNSSVSIIWCPFCKDSGKFAGRTEKVKGLLLRKRFYFLASLTYLSPTMCFRFAEKTLYNVVLLTHSCDG